RAQGCYIPARASMTVAHLPCRCDASGMANPSTRPDDPRIEQLFHKQRAHQAEVKRAPAEARVAKLELLRAAILEREAAIRDAMFKDFRKSATEVDLTELYPSLVEIKDAIGSLHKWMKPQRVPTPMA